MRAGTASLLPVLRGEGGGCSAACACLQEPALTLAALAVQRRRDAGELAELAGEEIDVAVAELLGDVLDGVIRLAEQPPRFVHAGLEDELVRRDARGVAEA